MLPKESAWEKQGQTLIKRLGQRNIEGYYCKNGQEVLALLKEKLPQKAVVTWGGSETLNELGVLDMLKEGPYQVLDRSQVHTPEESRTFYQQAVGADAFFMSSNAITLAGELINIDGNGNRVACLIQGPKEVYVIAGMNKVVPDVQSGIARIQNQASPANTARLQMKTPCYETGVCGDCQSKDCICCQVVVTRRSMHQGRIKVILVGETVGF